MPRSLSAEDCLDEFFADRRRGAVGSRLARLGRAERTIRDTVERTAELVLTDEELVLVHAERQFDARDAVARIMPAPGLLLVVEAYLAHLEQNPSRSADRRVALDTCASLTRHLARELRHLDVAPATHRIEQALQGCGAAVVRPTAPRRLLKAIGLG